MKKILIITSLLIFFSGLQSTTIACTNFVISKNGKLLYYTRNYDRDMRNAIIMVNKRGVYKRAQVARGGHKWVSLYGSITNNQYGRDFPAGGINERGLVVEGTMLPESQSYNGPANLPGVNPGQFVQFLLDVSSSVEKAIENAKKVRYTDIWVPGHYLICDSVSCAIIEFLGDSVNVYTGEDLGLTVNNEFIPVRVSANSTYASSLETLSHYTGYGNLPGDTLTCSMKPQYFGAAASHETDNSLSRFVLAAHQIRKVEATLDPETFNVDSAFNAMEIIVQKGQWSKFQIVYDLQNIGLSWRSIYEAEPKEGVLATPRHETIYLKDFDLSNTEPVQISNMQDPSDPLLQQDTLEPPIQDLVYGEFIDYDIKYNKEIVVQADTIEIHLENAAKGYLGSMIPDELFKTKEPSWWASEFMRPMWYKYPDIYTSTSGYVTQQSIFNFYLDIIKDPISVAINKRLNSISYLDGLNSASKGSISVSPYSAGFSTKFSAFPIINMSAIKLFEGGDNIGYSLADFSVQSGSDYLFVYGKFSKDVVASLNLYYSYKKRILGHYDFSVWPPKWIPTHYKTYKIPFSGSVKVRGITFKSIGPYTSSGSDMNTCLTFGEMQVIADYDDIIVSIYDKDIIETVLKPTLEKEIQKQFHNVFDSYHINDLLGPLVTFAVNIMNPFCIGTF
jgi:choloylglycine hydrolase